MSDFLQNNRKRINDLCAFTKGIIEGKSGTELIEKYQEAIEQISPGLTIAMVDEIMKEGYKADDIKKSINKVLNVFYKKLDQYRIEPPEEIPFVFYLMRENAALDVLLKKSKEHIKKLNKLKEGSNEFRREKDLLLKNMKLINDFEQHYLKKENILFPYLEKTWPDYRCVHLMWSYHDDIRSSHKNLLKILEQQEPDILELNEEVGRLYFLIYTIMFREDAIVFPVALESVNKDDWQEMHLQSFEYGFPLIPAPGKISPESKTGNRSASEAYFWDESGFVDLQTGNLNATQLIKMLNALPVDITFVDENNKVRYFSSPRERIFPRSKAVIGRYVENCHPPESVHIVEQLVEDLKSGKKDMERFWIQMKGRFILIDYYALRDEQGNYKGVIEVSQDVTDIRKLQGEKRLMD